MRPADNYHVEELFSEFEEVDQKDLLDGFLLETDKKITNKKILKKIENPLIALSKNLGLKLQIFGDFMKKTPNQETETFYAKKELIKKPNFNKTSENKFSFHEKKTSFPYKKMIDCLSKDSSQNNFRQTIKNKTFDLKKTSMINISKALDQVEIKAESFYRSGVSLERNNKMKRKNLKQRQETLGMFPKPRKLTFMTQVMEN